MSVSYLVDYENVHETGLIGMKSLTQEDSVYIFHTQSSDRITLSWLENVDAWVRVILVPSGDQSLDMHLVSFLGYLIGREDNPENQYVIVSCDSDYHGVSNFWNDSYQRKDKVNCAPNIRCDKIISSSIEKGPLSSVMTKSERSAICEYIFKTFERIGITGRNGWPCMLFSEFCTYLNRYPEYCETRKKTAKTPMHFFSDEFQDILMITKRGVQDWVFLVAERYSSVSADASVVLSIQSDENASTIDENLFDDMDLKDLAIDNITEIKKIGDAVTPNDDIEPMDDPVSETKAFENEEIEEAPEACEEALNTEKEASNKEQDDTQPAKTKTEHPDFLTAAIDMIQSADEQMARNDNGHIRASAVRDLLLGDPEFRLALKNSGMKPLEYIQYLFKGKIDIYLSKGTHWARLSDSGADTVSAEGDEASESAANCSITQHKKAFYEKAFSNIHNRLCEAGIDGVAADEIADIILHSKTEDEPRKAIHTLLCQLFGNKNGSKYYRQAVKYVHIS